MRLLARRASTLLAVLALALSARVTEAQSRYIGEADASTIGRRGFSDKRARSVRTRYSGSLSRSNRYRGRDRRLARRLMQAESPAEPPAAWGPVGAPPPTPRRTSRTGRPGLGPATTKKKPEKPGARP